MPQPKLCAAAPCPFYAKEGHRFCTNHLDRERQTKNYNVGRHRNPARKKRQALYNSARWREVREEVKRRDSFMCTWPDCGATDDLVVDHIGGIDWDNPFDPSLLRTLCRHHSGKIDGGRSSVATQ